VSGLVLSLFPGIGLLDMAFEEEGFCVVRGPDVLWGGDIRRFHPPAGKFDGVIGGPPCQQFSAFRHLVMATTGRLKPNLIPEYERVVKETHPTWFVMENVPAAPLPNVDGYYISAQLVRDVWVGGATSRCRRISFGRLNGSSLVLGLSIDGYEVLYHEPLPAVWSTSRATKKRSSGDSPAGPRLSIEEMARRQGVSLEWLKNPPFKRDALDVMIGNGVPLPMGRAIARAVKAAITREAVPA
jgi:DNA (cytosine-5)-methyltransferase 1